MNILITGCGGFVGSHLAEAELQRGNRVYGIDLAPTDKVGHIIGNERFEYVQQSILEGDALETLVEASDIVYHLAAIANVQTYCDDPIRVMDVNIDGVRRVAKAAWYHGRKLVFSSSSEVYGKSPAVPFSEHGDSLLGPTSRARWCYAASKRIGEHYVLGYGTKGARVSIARFFNFYGPRLDLIGYGRVIPCFLEKFLTGKPVEVVEPGDQTRCLTYITDGVDALVRMAHMDAANGEIFNIGSTNEIGVRALAELMKRIGGFTSPIISVTGSQFYGSGHEEIPRRVPDVSHIERTLGWHATTSLDEGLAHTIRWFEAQHQSV